jgi:two-component system chemotaxis response regulator CheB
MIRILIVDDSITQREILRRVLEADAEFAIVGEASDGKFAVEMVKEHEPDVVLMDVHMPDMDGVEATRQIMSQCPVPIVIISATLRKRDVDHGLSALEAGAVSIVEKSKGAALLHLKTVAPELREAIIAASQAKVKPRAGAVSAVRRVSSATAATVVAQVEVVGICTSTGGPRILVEILSSLPSPYPLSILLVQHISEPFAEGFAIWLSGRTGQTVRIARDDQHLEPGIWLGPPGKHLTLGSRNRIKLIPKSPTDIHCPSGNLLFSSLAKHLGSQAVGVQLTGMGDDGARGLLELKQAGGQTLIQNEASCMIYGMPKAAKKLGAATHELSHGDIAVVLSQRANRRTANKG